MADLDNLYAVIKREKGHLDIVFANAGGGTFLPLEQSAFPYSARVFG
jgi:hypothetical protein